MESFVSCICKHCTYTYTLYHWHEYRMLGYCSKDCHDGKEPTKYVYIKGQKYDMSAANIKLNYSTKFLGDLYA